MVIASLKKLIPYNSKVLLKPNMLNVESKGSIVITNAVLFEAVIRIIRDYTNDIIFGDSPGVDDSRRVEKRGGLY